VATDYCEKNQPSWKRLTICEVDKNNFCLIIKEITFCREVESQQKLALVGTAIFIDKMTPMYEMHPA